ncbi:FAD-dependent oxidoreductase [Anaeromyxobacter dehalogenans]|uniref:FAD dependent oxidoreductase n=1 Tax=Anaeromyxobacter dehalogenans (strain 2CP-C) TaxID=290397 RepID=Q2IKR6_ANADE|nr:FAD-dependent oxidoreductase [Anaeromyxobacter dehalogenans]ABC82249.1 FAD dependent oxidoreductase [Anaeromyxobacter dehalogenans 2CP-C]
MGKRLVCACEDVSLDEVRRAFAAGHRDLESVKRVTGLGTGPCQGKSCVARVAQELLRLGATPAEIQPFTARTPVQPVPLAALAALDPAGLPLDDGVPLAPPGAEPPGPAAHPQADPLPPRADVVIVGGGIQGLSIAYELARRGVRDVLVLEQGYLNAGASGRNGGGVRAQWTTPTMIRLASRSLELCDRFAVEMGINVWFRRSGYLFLAPTAEQVSRIERNAELHRREGLRTRVVGPDEALQVVPELDPRRFRAAAWNPDDGVVFPWPFLWGYASRAEALGAKVRTFTRVTGFDTAGPRVTAVRTDRGRVACELVVVAAGAWSRDVAALAGVSLPNRPTRHEILVTEPLKPWLGPLVSVLGNGLYFSQSQRGEIVGGMGDPDEPEGVVQGSTLRFLARFARAAVETVPRLGEVKVIRQWAGCYDVTPDNNPVLGPAGFENFHQCSGFVGHGFMMAPAVAERYADWLAGRGKDEIFERFTLGRFESGAVAREDFIIG